MGRSTSRSIPSPMALRYGVNPHLRPAYAEPVVPGRWPLRPIHGTPSYVNLLDVLAGWRLVREAATVSGRPAAASFKHVSPAGAALDGPVDGEMARTFGVRAADLGPVARAYVRARDADPTASYGDVIAVSHPVDVGFARLLRRKASDAIVAPGYEPGAVELLAAKKGGRFLVVEADPDFEPPGPPAQEVREIFGLRLVQPGDHVPPDRALVASGVDGTVVPDSAVEDLLLGLVVLRYTQSNSVAYLRDGMALGIGAGQQSRIGCTQVAGAKVEAWYARRASSTAPADRGLALVSDGMIAFRDNVDEAARRGVAWIAEPGGSTRDDEVARACDEHGITLVRTGLRLFQH